MKITLQILLSREFGWWRSRGTRLNIATTPLSSLEILPSCWCPTTFHITIARDAWCHLLRREGTSGTMNNEYVFTWLSWKTIEEHTKETDLPTLFIALLTCKLV